MILSDVAQDDVIIGGEVALRDKSYVVLDLKHLTIGAYYTFQLKAWDEEGMIGIGRVKVRVNEPPKSGVFTITPTVGVAHVTEFTFRCFAWEDERK